MSTITTTCGNCEAQLAPGAAWCGQCLTPVQQPQVQATGAGLVDPRRPERQQVPTPEYSRWKGGPESFGPGGRIIMTLLLILGLIVGYFFFQGGMVSIASVTLPLVGSLIMYGLIAAFIGAWAIKSIWKRTRVK